MWVAALQILYHAFAIFARRHSYFKCHPLRRALQIYRSVKYNES